MHMDANNENSLGRWVDERMASLDQGESYEPNVSAGFVRLHQRLSAKTRGSSRLLLAGVCVAAVLLGFLAFPSLPSPHVLAHKCFECSVAVWQTLAASSSQATLTPQVERQAAPNFQLKDADGRDVALANLKGKVVLVNFWATWCHGCQTEIPWLIEFQQKFADRGFVVVGISLDDDGWKSVGPWLKEKKLNYPIVIGNPALGKQYGLDGMPLTVLVDQQGRVADAHPGLINRQETEQRIRTLLNENSKSHDSRSS
jgi:peroxiredoxin